MQKLKIVWSARPVAAELKGRLCAAARRLTLHKIATAVTLIGVVVSLNQTCLLREQVALMRDAEDRLTRPVAKVTLLSRGFGLGRLTSEDGKANRTEFVGFTLTNATPFAIMVTGWHLELGVEEASDTLSLYTYPTPVDSFEEEKLSDMDYPRRLQYGEAVSVLFRREDMLARLRREGEECVTRVRPGFQDSLGNTYSTGSWVEWTEDGWNAYDRPCPGYLSSEEKEGP